MTQLNPDKKNHILRRLAEMERERASWEPVWRDLARHFLPMRSRFLNAGERTNDGSRLNKNEDGIGILARRILSGGLQSGLTSPSRPWFALGVNDPRLARMEAVRRWLQYVYEQMTAAFNRSNFYDQIHLLYDEMVTFGAGDMLVEDDPVSVVRFRTLTVGEYCLATDAAGRVDTVYRRVRMTARQITQAWPEDAPESIRHMAERDHDEWLTVIHAVEPNPDHVDGALDKKSRLYSSTYLLESGELLEESGYFEFPFICPRWNSTASDIYGSSPAMDALGDCRQLQKMVFSGRLALEKEVNPPLGVYGAQNIINTSPGAVNPISTLAQGQVGIVPLYQVKANLPALSQEKEALKRQIKEMFFNDLFLMLNNAPREMTAFEVAERNSEKMMILGPVLDRLRSEGYQPLIERVFGIMSRRGLIPPPPPELEGQEIKIEFISILAQAQKQAGLAAVNSTVAFIGQVAQFNPEALDKIDLDETIDEVAEMNGVPPAMIRSDDAVAQLRAQRQQQQQMREAMAAAQQGADIAAAGAKAAVALPPEAMAALTGALGGANGAA